MKYAIHHILGFLEEWAPQSTKLEYDNVGLLVGDGNQPVERILTCLDVTPEVVDEAVETRTDLIIAHHPLIFRKLSRITPADTTGSLLYRLIKADIGLIAAHTNLDAASEGVSFVLAERLGLKNQRFLKQDESPVDVPPSGAGAGRTGGHTSRDAGSGTAGEAAEFPKATGFGVIGEFDQPLRPEEFLKHVAQQLDSRGIRYAGSPDEITRVAVCGGSGSFLKDEAVRQKADAFVTADLKYHDFFLEAPDVLLVDAGHYESEVPVVGLLRDRLRNRFPGLAISSTQVNTNPVRYFQDKTKQE
ncbi:Nif3-like dinuclear metal center hexameric protein [Balneolales bacterium ANBcel1]|nr:Nif3-like dinuclear metal center hexameric protein [Balneolales bacterium ANBcel1]